MDSLTKSVNTCFLCLQKDPILSENVSTDMISVFQYLNINPGKIMPACFSDSSFMEPGKSSGLSGNQEFEFTVKLCSSCQDVVWALENLIEQNKLLSTVVNYLINLLHQIIVASSAQVNLPKISHSNTDVEQQKLILTQLKAVISEKCHNPELNTGNVCFACAENVSKCSEDADDSLETDGNSLLETFNLRNILHFFKINPKCNNSDENDANCCTVNSWNFCSDCKAVTEELDSLIEQLEIVSMLTTQHLKIFYGTLTENDEQVGPSDGNRILRKEIKVKCFQRLTLQDKTDFPQILPTSSSTMDLEAPSSSQQQTPGSSSKVSTALLSEASSKRFIWQSFEGKYFEKLYNGSHIRCLVCSTNFLYNSFHHHFVNSHPEKLFKQSESSTKQQFTQKVQSILKDEVDQSKQVGGKLQCQHCQVKSQHVHNLRYHLLIKHFEILEEKINSGAHVTDSVKKAITTKPSETAAAKVKKLPVPEIKEKIFANDNACNLDKVCKDYFQVVVLPLGKLYLCPDCKIKLPMGMIKYHMLTYHPEKLFEEKRLEGVTQEGFAACCRHVFSVQISQGKQFIFTKGKRHAAFKCGYCKKVYNDKRCFQHHLTSDHFEKLVETVISVQKNGTPLLE